MNKNHLHVTPRTPLGSAQGSGLGVGLGTAQGSGLGPLGVVRTGGFNNHRNNEERNNSRGGDSGVSIGSNGIGSNGGNRDVDGNLMDRPRVSIESEGEGEGKSDSILTIPDAHRAHQNPPIIVLETVPSSSLLTASDNDNKHHPSHRVPSRQEHSRQEHSRQEHNRHEHNHNNDRNPSNDHDPRDFSLQHAITSSIKVIIYPVTPC